MVGLLRSPAQCNGIPERRCEGQRPEEMLSVSGEPPIDLWLSHYRSAEVVIAIVKVSPTGPGLSMTSLWERY